MGKLRGIKIGEVFNRLTVVRELEETKKLKGTSNKKFVCQCSCGNKATVAGGKLLSSHTKSCGCYQKSRASKSNIRTNEYKVKDGIVYAKFNKEEDGQFILDEEDLHFLSDYCFYKSDHGYATTNIKSSRKSAYLHRLIMNPPTGFVADHKSGDGLDNRRQNLRVCKHEGNSQNRGKTIHKYYRGVSRSDAKSERYNARIGFEGETIHLGTFSTPKLASEAYEKEAKKLFGEFYRPPNLR